MTDSSGMRLEEISIGLLHSLEEDKKTFVLELRASWCHPCKLMEPILEEISSEYYDRGLQFYKIDVDAYNKILDEYTINSVPTILFFREGEIIRKLKGFYKKDSIVEVIQNEMSIST